MKVVINKCFGGFCLSNEAISEYLTRKKIKFSIERGVFGTDYYINNEIFICYDIPRDDLTLISIIEDLGSDFASGECSKLSVVDVPDGIEYEITEYDGYEKIVYINEG